jgi:Family of unknown function (DUF6412)
MSAIMHALSVVLGTLPMPAGLVVGLATVAVVGVAAALLASHRSDGRSRSAVRVRAVALRECARQSVRLRLRDPDAPGRTRPRAPGRFITTA